jgi:hypothetical protein
VRSTGTNESLEFERTAVGGTFDRLHAGHRILLAATALVSTAHVYVGVTGGNVRAQLIASSRSASGVEGSFDEQVEFGLVSFHNCGSRIPSVSRTSRLRCKPSLNLRTSASSPSQT